MANVTVWKFDSPGGAASAAARLDTLAIEGAGQIVDGAVIEWAESQRKARLTPLRRRSTEGAFGRRFWRWLFDALFADPTSTDVCASAPASITEPLAQASIDDESIHRLRVEITPGTSALFLVADRADLDRTLEAFGGASRSLRLVHSNLPEDQEAQLRATFTAR
jgi:uncharacterized membrane protein